MWSREKYSQDGTVKVNELPPRFRRMFELDLTDCNNSCNRIERKRVNLTVTDSPRLVA